MTSDEFQKLVLEELLKINTRLSSVETNMATKQDIVKLEQRFDQLDEKLEKDVHNTMKLTYKKIESIETKFDDRLDNIETDVNYLVAKSARYGNEIDKLKNHGKTKNSL